MSAGPTAERYRFRVEAVAPFPTLFPIASGAKR